VTLLQLEGDRTTPPHIHPSSAPCGSWLCANERKPDNAASDRSLGEHSCCTFL